MGWRLRTDAEVVVAGGGLAIRIASKAGAEREPAGADLLQHEDIGPDAGDDGADGGGIAAMAIDVDRIARKTGAAAEVAGRGRRTSSTAGR